MSKKKVEITKLALIDLENILAYTYEEWGGKQARKYWQTIRNSFYEIDTGVYNQLKYAVGSRNFDYKEYIIEKHRVIVRETPQSYIIIRVLHQSMDTKRHL